MASILRAFGLWPLKVASILPLVSGDDLASGTDDLGDIFGEVGKVLHTKMGKQDYLGIGSFKGSRYYECKHLNI